MFRHTDPGRLAMVDKHEIRPFRVGVPDGGFDDPRDKARGILPRTGNRRKRPPCGGGRSS